MLNRCKYPIFYNIMYKYGKMKIWRYSQKKILAKFEKIRTIYREIYFFKFS